MPRLSVNPAGLGGSWAMIGYQGAGRRAELMLADIGDMSITRGIVDVTSMGSLYPQHIPGSTELAVRGMVATQVNAATFAECMQILARSWDPDHYWQSGQEDPAGWRSRINHRRG